MIIKYYGHIDELLAKINSFCEENGYMLRIVDRIININEYAFEIKEGDYEFRTYSVPRVQNRVLLIETSCSVTDSKIEEFLRKLSLVYSELEQNTIWNDMPILQEMARRYSKKFQDIAIIFRDHFLEDNMALLRTFEECGVHPNDILVFDKGDKTKRQLEITETFIQRGYNVGILDNAIIDNYELVKKYKKTIETFCTDRKDKKIVVMDDGAIVTKLLSYNSEPNIIGIVELTEMGIRRIKDSNVLKDYTILDAAKTQLKRNLTYPEIANSVFKRIIELLYGVKMVGRTVMILGYGDLGSILAERFRSWGVNVVVYDVNTLKLIMAAENGFKTYDDPIRAVKQERIFMLIGSSGYRSIDREILESINSDVIVTAAATADTLALEQMPYDDLFTIEEYGVQIHLKGSVITRLGNGRSINLFLSESIPNQANDIFKASNFLCALLLTEKSFSAGLHLEIVDKFFLESGIYDLYYDKYFKSKDC